MRNSLPAILLATLAFSASAGTYTWTGAAGDGQYFTAGNWDYDGAPAANAPGNAPADDIVMNNAGTIEYNPGGDWMPSGTVTISGNTTFVQINGNAWFLIRGDLVIRDGGTFDTGTSERLRIAGSLTLDRGGVLLLRTTIFGDSNNAALYLNGGTAPCPGEFKIENLNFENRGTAISGTLLSPQSDNTVMTFHSGSLVCTSGSYEGLYCPGGSHINVAPGSTSTFTMPRSAANIYSTYFSGDAPRIRYDGAPITQTEFEELFLVEDAGNNTAVFKLKPTADTTPVFGQSSATSAVSGGAITATFTGVLVNAGDPAATVTLVYGLADGGSDSISGWAHSISLGTAASDVPFGTTVTGLDPLSLYHYAFVADTGAELVWSSSKTVATLSANPADIIWFGSQSTDSRIAANWFPERVPGEGDQVHVLSDFSRRSLDWYPSQGGDTVGTWTQDDSTDHYVIFHTTADDGLVVTGNVSIASGAWTHVVMTDGEPMEMLNVTVGGDMVIGAPAFVTAGRPNGDTTGRPWTSAGHPRGLGPGYQRSAGASFAGDGGHTNAYTGVSYGSILDPLSYGSGGYGDNDTYAGGGIVKLAVGGTLTVNGTLCSRGFGYALDNDFIGGAGSGGSVNVVCGALAGSGTIDANGGTRGLCGSGSGGRVSVRLTGANATFADFTGFIEAEGGYVVDRNTVENRDIAPAAAGTVALQTATEAAKVVVHNELRTGNGINRTAAVEWYEPVGEGNEPSATHLPAMQDTDAPAALRATNWELSGHGAIRLTADTRVASLTLSATNGTQRVYTDGHTLRTSAFIAGTTALHGVLTSTTLPGIVLGNGSIVVDDATTVILVR